MKTTGLWVSIILMLGALLAPFSGALASTDIIYNHSENTAAWDGTDASRTKATSADYNYTYGDEASLTYTLPWSFVFYDQAYNQITVDTNGNVWFGATGSANSFNLASSGRGPVIAAWNNDLSSYYYGGVFIQHKTNPERVVIEWQTETYADEGYYLTNNFEVVLYKDRSIRLNYKTFNVSDSKDFGSGISKGEGSESLSLSSLYGNGSVTTLAGRSFVFNEVAAVTINNTYASPITTITQTLTGTLRGTSIAVTVDTAAVVGPITYPTPTTWNCTVSDLVEGNNTISVTAIETAGSNATARQTIVVDTTAPIGTIAINNGASATNSTAVTLTLSASDASGVVSMMFSNDSINWSPAEAYATSKAWTLTDFEGAKTVYVRFKDGAGNWSTTTISDSIFLDTTGPVGGVSINVINGIKYPTNSSAVTLTPFASDARGVVSMMFSNDNITWSPAEAFATSKAWTLTTGEGTKTVYARYKDGVGNWSTATISDSINLDTTAPTGSMQINNGAAYTNSTAVTLTMSTSDLSGVASMMFSNDNITWSAAEAYATYKNWTLAAGEGTQTVYVRYKDGAGNWSTTTISATIVLDTTWPIGAMAINNGAAYTNSTAVTLNLSASDASGVVSMNFSNYNITDNTRPLSPAEAYATSKAWTLTAGEGTKYVVFHFTDKAGNSNISLSSIILDTTRPMGTMLINGGATYTNSTAVTLILSASDAHGVVSMMFSNDNITWSPEEAYTTSKAWILTTGDGTKTVYAKFKDTAGNWSTAAIGASIVFDTLSPVTSASPAGGTYTTPQSVTLSCGDGSGAGCDKIYYTTNGSTPTIASSVYTSPISVATTNSILQFFAIDKAGNSEAIKSQSYTIPLSVQINSPVGTVNTSTPLLDYTVNYGTVTVKVDNVVVSKISGNYLDAVYSGPHSLRVETRDAAGNIIFAESAFTVALDVDITVDPSVSYTNSSYVSLYGTRTGGTTVQVTSDNGAIPGAISYSSPTTWYCPVSGLVEGDNTFTITATDALGKSTTIRKTVTMDTVPPTVVFNSPAGFVGATPLLDITVNGGTVNQIWVDGEPVTKVNGDHLDALQPGDHYLEVQASDPAYNQVFEYGFFTVDAPPLLITPVIKASSGSYHTAAILKDGSLWAWGSMVNEYDYLDETISPLRIGTENDWNDIAVGSYHTVALKRDGSLWAWGWNGYGQLGNGTTDTALMPVRIGLENNWASIAAGGFYTLALKRDGSLWAWGSNASGQLGDGTVENKLVPVMVGSIADQWTAISANEDGHVLALKSDGTLWSWGDNYWGQVGDGTRYNQRLTPVQVGNDTDLWKSISSGRSLSVAIKSDGTMWKWGYNGYGQPGDEGGYFWPTPNQIGDDTGWTSVSAGGAHVLALKTDGSMWSWGSNYWGQLGNFSWDDVPNPVMIGVDHVATLVPMHGDSSFVIKSDGSLWAWGYNGYGQLENSPWEGYAEPFQERLSRGNGLLINGGAQSTHSTAVVLSYLAFAYSSVTEMQFSYDNITWSDPETYANTRNWTLTDGDGTKTVYARFKNGIGEWSQVYSASIVLDSLSPVTSALQSGGIYATAQSVTLSCSDGTGTGCDKIYYTTDGSTPTTASSVYISPISFTATGTLQYFATDKAGNSEVVKSQGYTIDTTPPAIPTPTLDVLNKTTSKRPTIQWSAIWDAARYRLLISTDSGFQAIQTSTDVTGISYTPSSDLADGTYYWKVSSLDQIGNQSAYSSVLNTTIDTTAPPQVTGLTAIQQQNSVRLSWGAIGIADDFNHYNIYRSTAPFSNVSQMSPISQSITNPGVTGYVDNAVTQGNVYYYAVTGVDNLGNENKTVIISGPIHVWGLPLLTINPAASPTRAVNLTLSGTYTESAVITVTSNSGASIRPVVQDTNLNTWTCPVEGVAVGENIFTVTATNAAGSTESAITIISNHLAAAISPTTITANHQGNVGLTITNLPVAGDEALVEQFVDANRNGLIDAGDYVVRAFKVTDGATVTNPNVLKDTDTAANLTITTTLGYNLLNDLYHAPGEYLVRVTKDTESVTVSLKVTQVSQTETIAGTVTDGTNPVPGAMVQLTDKWQRPVSYVIADASGSFVLNVKQPGDYLLLPLAYGHVASVTPVTLAASQNIENQALTLTAGTNHVTGNVKDAASGAGIPGVWVQANGNGTTGVAITNSSGAFETWLPSGQYSVTVPAALNIPGLAAKGYAGFDKQPVSVTISGTTVIPDISLPVGDIPVSGHVLDPLGNPVAGVPVEGKIRGATDIREPVTFGVSDASGAYALGLFSATNWDIFLDNAAAQPLGFLGTIRRDLSTATGPLENNDLTVHPVTAWVQGVVKDSASQLLPGVEVRLRNNDSTIGASVSSANDGAYRIGAYAGSWFIDALTENRGTHSVSEQSLTLVDGQTATVDFVVDVTPPTLTVNPVVTPTNINHQTITGTMESGAVVTVTTDSSATAGQVSYPNQTAWSCDISNLQEGANRITVTAMDTSENPATASPVITLDTTPPTVFINSPINGGGYGPTPSLSYTVSDGAITVKVDGVVVNKVSGNSLDALAAGPHTVRVEAIDAAGNLGIYEVNFSVIYQALAIATNSLPSGVTGAPYNQTLAATGGKTPHTWSITSGSLPSGLTLNATTGVISGTPIAAGTNSFTMQVIDALGSVATHTLGIDVIPQTLRIEGKSGYLSIQAAYDAAANNDVIKVQAQTFNENFVANRNITVTIDGGYTSDYASNPNMTDLRGSVTLNSGTVIMQNFHVLE